MSPKGPLGPRVRGILRLSSALTLLSFVTCHLTNHSLALVSLKLANSAHHYLLDPWRSPPGTLFLLTAALTHYFNALWSIFVRRSFRLSAWQIWQLGLGLTIPFLWMLHFASTRLAEEILKVTPDYTYILLMHWVVRPLEPLLQSAMLLTVWTHASIGVHFWLRPKAWYPAWRNWLLAFALVLPTLALSGYVAAGNQVARLAEKGSYTQDVLDDANVEADTMDRIFRIAAIGWMTHLGLLLTPFALRSLRALARRSRGVPTLTHPSGRLVPIAAGATILEALQDSGIPHASVCGGRGRCTTCRVRILDGFEALHPPGALEAKALDRFHAAANVRLACQTRPTKDVSIAPLLPPEGRAALSAMDKAMDGVERSVTVVFVDLRGSTRLGEAKLPYDVLFILNQFFQEMNAALVETGGHYANFTGDGLMALYGIESEDASGSAIAAFKGAWAMLERLDRLNSHLAAELAEPLRIGIGIHSGNAIVGTMGPPTAQHTQALGDTVNTTARLESLTKEHDCPLILSRQAADLAGLRLGGEGLPGGGEVILRRTSVKGKEQEVEFYPLQADQCGLLRKGLPGS